MKSRENTNELCFEICDRLKDRFVEISNIYGPSGNAIGAFFHDLVIHFTGIVIHRNTLENYGNDIDFPWVNKEYALSPRLIKYPYISSPQTSWKYEDILKALGLLPVATGQSLPLGYASQRFLSKLLKVVLAHPPQSALFLPGRATQLTILEELIHDLCRDYDISNRDIVSENWRQYAEFHTTDKQERTWGKGVMIGTRNNLHNRKLALNYLQQGKEVVGFTHGEISNHVFDEPLFGYSEKTLCTTVVDYGSFRPESVLFPPIITPDREVRRNSPVIENMFRRCQEIEYQQLRKTRNLLIPTIYQQNHLYGPIHAYESKQYYRWHGALEKCVPNLTVKIHPKTRFKPTFNCRTEFRQLDECIEEYDVLLFDYFATGSVLAIFSRQFHLLI